MCNFAAIEVDGVFVCVVAGVYGNSHNSTNTRQYAGESMGNNLSCVSVMQPTPPPCRATIFGSERQSRQLHLFHACHSSNQHTPTTGVKQLAHRLIAPARLLCHVSRQR